MGDELLETKGKPGRKQTLVAKAWITRKTRRSVFRSHVSLGDGRVFKLSTATRRRELALDFCRLHLAHHLSKGAEPYVPPASPSPAPLQAELFSPS